MQRHAQQSNREKRTTTVVSCLPWWIEVMEDSLQSASKTILVERIRLMDTYETFDQLNVECSSFERNLGDSIPKWINNDDLRSLLRVCVLYQENVFNFVEFWKIEMPTAHTPTYSSMVELFTLSLVLETWLDRSIESILDLQISAYFNWGFV